MWVEATLLTLRIAVLEHLVDALPNRWIGALEILTERAAADDMKVVPDGSTGPIGKLAKGNPEGSAPESAARSVVHRAFL